MPAPSPVAALVELIEESYRRAAWHGPNLRAALRGVGAEEAGWSPAPGRPSIHAITLHCAYWKRKVLARIGGVAPDVPRLARDWPEELTTADEAAWRADRRLLDRMHTDLVAAVRALSPRQLERPGPHQRRTRLQHLRGIALHDVYHAGQIRLLRKLYEGQAGRS